MRDSNLVTTYTFHGQEYLFRMKALHNNLEILVTDKHSGEEWQCSYDATYIENLTHKTGNFKQFDIFIAMIKSGVLKTSESVTLDLLTFEELELLRSRKITRTLGSFNSNRRYLIVTYIVEFDKIRYPLPLEYCGPPDPVILQTTIRRLEVELAKTKEELALRSSNNESKKIYFLQKRVEQLTEENTQLKEDMEQISRRIEKKHKPNYATLQTAVNNLERSVAKERSSHHELVQKLKNDKIELMQELEKLKVSERSLKSILNNKNQPSQPPYEFGDNYLPINAIRPGPCTKTLYKNSRSPTVRDFHGSGAVRIRNRSTSGNRPRSRLSRRTIASPCSSTSSSKYHDPHKDLSIHSRSNSPQTPKCSSGNSSRVSSINSVRRRKSRNRHFEYQKLQEKIEDLQKILKSNIVRTK
ncbi:centrosomal protein CCDC61-like [Cylas formicarius]|uniref:centrosomal protein CCDC61-like n=1 Tax=Cylas formicarius TaxID=197179 RepID=UPI0029589603|nr:centrosomal protein CCDC61-like [Cylas formicarius]